MRSKSSCPHSVQAALITSDASRRHVECGKLGGVVAWLTEPSQELRFYWPILLRDFTRLQSLNVELPKDLFDDNDSQWAPCRTMTAVG